MKREVGKKYRLAIQPDRPIVTVLTEDYSAAGYEEYTIRDVHGQTCSVYGHELAAV